MIKPEDSDTSVGSDEGFSTSAGSNLLLQELIHTALKIRMDLQDTPGHDGAWHRINSSSVEKVISESLFLFLSVLFGGLSAMEGSDQSNQKQNVIYSIAPRVFHVFTGFDSSSSFAVYGKKSGWKVFLFYIGSDMMSAYHLLRSLLPLWGS